MKKILCLILTLIMLPSIWLFAGCDTGKTSLSSLNQDYNEIYQNSSIVSLNKNKLTFNYNGYTEFQNNINSSEKIYQYIPYYNEMASNMMVFANNYLESISLNNKKVDKKLAKKLYKELDELKVSVEVLDKSIKTCADNVNIFNPTNTNMLISLKRMFKDYNKFFESAFDFNATLIEIYFYDTELIDYSEKQDFDVVSADIECKLQARLRQQVVYSTQSFIEMNINNDNFVVKIADKTSTNFGGIINEYQTYSNNMKRLNKTYDETNIAYVGVDSARLNAFKNNIIALNNIQAVLNNEINIYKSACKSINYPETLENKNSTLKENARVELIKSFNLINNEYFEILTNLLTALGV